MMNYLGKFVCTSKAKLILRARCRPIAIRCVRARVQRGHLNLWRKAMSHFRLLLAGVVCASGLAAAPVAHSAVLNISVFDNGTLVGSAPPSTFGISTFSDNGTLDPNFSSITV